MSPEQAFELLRTRSAFSDSEAHLIASAFGVDWGTGPRLSNRSTLVIVSKDDLVDFLKCSPRSRPLGGFSTR